MVRLLALLLLAGASANAQTITTQTFGSGANSFSIEFVTIGNPGNAADDPIIIRDGSGNFIGTAALGSVAYTYKMGKYEISREQIEKANAAGGLGITFEDFNPNVGILIFGDNRPATGISWNEAARFVNYLNTSQGYQAAYNFTTSGADDNITLWTSGQPGYNASNPYRNSNAFYFLPNEDEWYKAAYYDPNKPGGAGYWNYPTGSDSEPNTSVSDDKNAVYRRIYIPGTANMPEDVKNAGSLSPYGTMAQGGNVWEWNENALDLINDDAAKSRVQRGGNWLTWDPLVLSASYRESRSASSAHFNGFRVASAAISLLEIQDGLVAYFPFYGNTNDESGNGNNGVVDGATLAADKYGNSQGCYYFGGYNKIQIPHSPNLAANQGTVSLWVKANTWATSDHIADIISKDDNPSGRQWVLQIHGTGGDFPDGAVRAGVFTESGLGYGDSTVTLPTATWVHLVQVWNGTNVRVYFNGAKIIESSASGNMAAGTGPVSIGGNTGSSLDGWIDNVRIYNRALSVQEIKLIYGQEKPDTEAPVITLFGSDPIQVYKGSTFTDPGATVTDDIDETRSIFGSGSVDQSTLGSYTITYTATDALGNIAIPVTRTVNVVLDPNGDENGDGISNGVAVLLGYSPNFNFAPLIDYLKTNPVAGLFSQSQYDANRTNGQSDILNNPNANGLYTTNQIHNLGLGGIVLNRDTNNQLILNYQVMESTDLQNWSPYQTYQLPITNAPTNKMFLRVQAVGP